MEAYPPQYVEHNLPLVLISGLGLGAPTSSPDAAIGKHESGTRLSIESPECRNERATQVLQEFLTLDGTQYASSFVALPGPAGLMRFKIKSVGRSYTLPARKAAPQPQAPGIEVPASPRVTELHSPLSPLSPSSPIFPDGVFTPNWFTKHQRQVPSLLICCFDFSAGAAAAQDEQIKNDILAVRGAIARSGYRTRFAAVMLSDKSILQAPEFEERLVALRRATGLDMKTGLFFMPPSSSQVEVASFVQTLMSTTQHNVVEFYRDLSKHARRKKTRGGPSQQSLPQANTAQILSTSGWNVRYEFKLGVFAEFRQEMDLAERHYTAAIEELFSSEGIFETTASWSPRWSDARLLADALAIRAIRCQLWSGVSTGAAQSWLNYKLRMKDLVDRRGRGSGTYSWDAWEGRWAGIMSQLIQLADVPSIQKALRLQPVDGSEGEMQQIYFTPEDSAVSTQPTNPFSLLHHPGYWLRLFANGVRARWEKALAIPEEDRVPPGQSPASAVANRFQTYDTYLVREPHEEQPLSEKGYDYIAELSIITSRAAEEFEAKRQIRMSEHIRYTYGKDLVRAEKYDEAIQVLGQVWETSTWRDERWHGLFQELSELLLDCIGHLSVVSNAALYLSIHWEVLALRNAKHDFDLKQVLATWDLEGQALVETQSSSRLSPFQIEFAFKQKQSHVGEGVDVQFSLQYTATNDARPLTLSKLVLRFDEHTSAVIDHVAADDSPISNPVPLQYAMLSATSSGPSHGTCDLSFFPGQIKVLQGVIVFREAKVHHIDSVGVSISSDKFALNHQYQPESIRPALVWYVQSGAHVERSLLAHDETAEIEILPRPPKLKMQLVGMRDKFYTGEQIRLTVQLINEESEATRPAINVTIVNQQNEMLHFEWSDEDEEGLARKLPSLPSTETTSFDLILHGSMHPDSFNCKIELRYTMSSNPEAVLEQVLTTEIVFMQALHAKFSLTPLLHDAPWPSYFNMDQQGDEDAPEGIPQLWRLKSAITTDASSEIILHDCEVIVDAVEGDAICHMKDSTSSQSHILVPHQPHDAFFDLETRKLSLDERRGISLDLSLAIRWSRSGVQDLSTTIIPMPRFTIPTSEPRVLCTIADVTHPDEPVLEYHIENPSGHFLTFNLTMEASDEFAFQGHKFRSFSIAPLSRHRVEYQLMPYHQEAVDEAAEGFWVRPNLQVVDSYYAKSLKVYPSGPRVRLDENKDVQVLVGGRSIKAPT